MPTADEAHHALIDQLIARGSLWSEGLMAAFRATPRHRFLHQLWNPRDGSWREVDRVAPSDEDLGQIYSDRAVTTRLSSPKAGEPRVALSSSSQPSLMAQMLEDLELEASGGREPPVSARQQGAHAPRSPLRVLEIGAGTGYNAALLAHVVGRVISLDIEEEVLANAREHLSAFPDRDVRLIQGDGRLGYPPAAPYDRIQVTAATDDLEPAWLAQLAPEGVVQAPLDLGPGLAWVVQGSLRAGVFEGRLTRAAFFMPLRDEGSSGRDRNTPAGPLPGPEQLQRVAPPWTNWPEPRSSGGSEWLTSLAFLGWLEGWTTGHANCPDGRPGYGLADLVRGEACWLGPYEWRVSGKAGHEMGLRLWRQWLDLGAPRPGEWRLRAVPVGGQVEEDPLARSSQGRRGRSCEQRWELVEPRRRGEVE